MSTLLLRLAAPLQSWGDESRFTRRETRTAPTKSGVLGLLAAAQGRRRTDSVTDLVSLRFGVRVDQTGRLLRDFQTAQRWDTGKRMPLSYRYYLSDAVFVAGVEGDLELLRGLTQAISNPAFPLFLGRRSCPPSRPVLIGVVDLDVEEALRHHEWEAAEWYRSRQPKEVRLRLLVDAGPSTQQAGVSARDVPVGFASERREYRWRTVHEPEAVLIENPIGMSPGREPDFFEVVSSA